LRNLIRLDRIDITLARLVCVLAVPTTVYIYLVFSPSLASIGATIFLVALGYLLARQRTVPDLHDAGQHLNLYRWLNMAFFGLFVYSIATYLLRPEAYVRPLEYYIATSLMAVVLFAEFSLTKNTPARVGLLKVVIITTSLVWTESLLYSGVVGVDPWYHQSVTVEIMQTGHGPEGVTYSGLLGMHYMVAGTIQLTGLSYKMATLISVSTIQMVCNPIFAYLIGRDLYDRKVGLVAALMVGTANWHIMFSYWTIPNGFALSLILPIVYIVLRLSKHWLWWLAGVGIALGGVVVATHPIASVMLALVLLLIWFGLWLYGILRRSTVPSRYFLLSSMATMGASLLYWYFVSDSLHYLVGLFRSGFSYEYWGSPVAGMTIQVSEHCQFTASFGEQLINYIGMLLFFALAIMGCLVACSNKLITQQRAAYTLAGFLILVVTFLGFIFQGAIIVGRWCYFAQIVLAIPLGIALIWMAGNNLKRVLPMSLLVFCLVFTMVMSPQANMDNNTFGPNTIVRSAFTQEEVKAMDEAVALWDGEIAVDEGYYIMRFKYPGRLVDMSKCIANADFTECEGMLVLVRDDIVDNPCKVGEFSPLRLTYDPRDVLKAQGFTKIYDWGMVQGYVASR